MPIRTSRSSTGSIHFDDIVERVEKGITSKKSCVGKQESHTHYISVKGVRNSICDQVLHYHKERSFCEPFRQHLMKMDKGVLDEYSNLEFVLQDYNIKFIFKKSNDNGNEFAYTIQDCRSDPDSRLAKKSFFSRLFK